MIFSLPQFFPDLPYLPIHTTLCSFSQTENEKKTEKKLKQNKRHTKITWSPFCVGLLYLDT